MLAYSFHVRFLTFLNGINTIVRELNHSLVVGQIVVNLEFNTKYGPYMLNLILMSIEFALLFCS
jgi:hypothetical protein